MLKPFDVPECPYCGDPTTHPYLFIAGQPKKYVCFSCGTKATSEGVILWAPGKEAQG